MERVYISGPITGTEDYMERFQRAEEDLKRSGFDIINPARIMGQLPELEHGECMKICLTLMDLCDGVYFLRGWRDSKGCSIEFEYAYEHEMAIFFERTRA